MKKEIYLIFFLLVIVAFSSCKKEELPLLEAKIVVLEGTLYGVSEDGNRIGIPVITAAPEDGGGTTVSFQFSTEGYDNPAVEGVDFTVENTVTFNTYYGTDTLFIQPVDNNLYEGNKTVDIIITSATNDYQIGSRDTCTFVITDDEHPLGIVLGSYSEADTDFNGDDEGPYNVLISPIDGNETQVTITNFWDGGANIIADVNLTANTITIGAGQVIYVSGTYGDCSMTWLSSDGTTFNAGTPISGSFDALGNITFQDWGARVSVGFFGRYDYSVLTKQKSPLKGIVNEKKVEYLK